MRGCGICGVGRWETNGWTLGWIQTLSDRRPLKPQSYARHHCVHVVAGIRKLVACTLHQALPVTRSFSKSTDEQVRSLFYDICCTSPPLWLILLFVSQCQPPRDRLNHSMFHTFCISPFGGADALGHLSAVMDCTRRHKVFSDIEFMFLGIAISYSAFEVIDTR